MADELFDDSISSLYERLIRAINEDEDLTSFSLDDFLDVYDYSRSLHDDNVSYAVMNYAEDAYPQCQDLIERKVIFYYDHGLDFLARKEADKLPDDSIVYKFIVLHATRVDDISFDSLKEYFCHAKPKSVEDVIVLFAVDVLIDMGLRFVVVDNAQYISSISQYSTSVYYALFQSYCETMDYHVAEFYARRLTELEPFQEEYWIEFSDLLNNHLNKRNQALEAIEFALAINPESSRALFSKACLLYNSNPKESEVIIDRILTTAPGDRQASFVKAILTIGRGDESEGFKMIDCYLKNDGTINRDGFDMLFYYSNSYPSDYILDELHRTLRGETSRSLYEWASVLSANGRLLPALSIVREGRKMNVLSPTIDVLLLQFSIMFQLEMFLPIIESDDWEMLENLDADLCPFELIKALSYVKIGDNESAVNVVRKTLFGKGECEQNQYDFMGNIVNTGARRYLSRLNEWLEGHIVQEADYNPFIAHMNHL